MAITKPISAVLGLALAALIMAATVPAARAVSARSAADLQAAKPTPSPVLYGPACPDVMVIAARGSGEGPADWQNLPAYTSDPYHGAGQTLDAMFADLNVVTPALRFSLDPVVYRADKVTTLAKHPAQYLSDAGKGAKGIELDIQATDAQCGGTVRYILAGYSLGAWAVHDALHQLSSAQLNELVGVALFGDPKDALGVAAL